MFHGRPLDGHCVAAESLASIHLRSAAVVRLPHHDVARTAHTALEHGREEVATWGADPVCRTAAQTGMDARPDRGVPFTLSGLDLVPKRLLDDSELGQLVDDPFAFRSHEALTLARIGVLDPVGPIPHGAAM